MSFFTEMSNNGPAQKKQKIKPVLGFTTTPKFRETSMLDFSSFVEKHFLWLCSNFDLLVTETTFETLRTISDHLVKAGRWKSEEVAQVCCKRFNDL